MKLHVPPKWEPYLDWTRLLPPHLRGQARVIGRMLLIALALRVALMPLFGGTDAMTTSWISTVLLGRGQLILSNDPPPIFYLNALVFGTFRFIFPANIYARFVSSVAYTPATFMQNSVLLEPGIAVLLSLLKLPYLIFDLATSILMLWLVKDPKLARTAMKWWLFNPIVLYVTYFVGQYDVVAVFFVVLAYYYQQNRRRTLALTALALAVFLKVFAIVLAPFFLILYLEESKAAVARLRAFGQVAAAAVVPLVLQFLITYVQPVYYESANYALSGDQMNGFFGTVIFNRGVPASPLAEGLLTFVSYSFRLPTLAPIPDVLFLLPLAYLILLLGWAYLRNKDFEKLWAASTVVFLFVYSLSLFHAQWFLWAQPFLILTAVRNRQRYARPYGVLVGLFFIYVWDWDALLTVLPLTPLVPAAANWAGPLTLLNTAGLHGQDLLNFMHTAFTAVGLFIAYLIVRKDILRLGTASS